VPVAEPVDVAVPVPVALDEPVDVDVAVLVAVADVREEEEGEGLPEALERAVGVDELEPAPELVADALAEPDGVDVLDAEADPDGEPVTPDDGLGLPELEGVTDAALADALDVRRGAVG
jgi:hypothetical protein